jgi:hypothetical protein
MVQFQNYGGQQAPQQQPPASQDPWDLVEGGGGIPAVKFGERDQYNRFIPAAVGTGYSGILVEDLVKNQVIDFDTKEPKWWKNGDPIMQVVATVQLDAGTFQPIDEDDYGLRRIYFKSGALTAFQNEVREKKIGRFGPGTRISIQLIGFKPNKDPNMNPANVFQVTIGPEFVPWIPPEQRAVDNVVGFAQPGTPAGVQQATQQALQAGFPPAQPPQQYVEPAQPQFPGQVVPQGAGNPVNPQQAAAPALVSQADVDAVTALTRVGLGIDQAVGSWANTQAQQGLVQDVPAFITALTAAVAGQ